MRAHWKNLLRVATLGSLPLLLAAVAGCGQSVPAAQTAASAEPTAVATVRPERQALRHSVEQPGQIEGFEQAPLYAKVGGYVRKLNVDIGDRVHAGQVLAELSVPELEEQLHQKEALAAQARAEVENSKRMVRTAEATIVRTEAALKLAEAGVTRADANFTYWQNESERARRLLPSASIDQSSAEQTFQQFKSAEAARDETRASIELSKATLGESKAQRDQAASAVTVAQAKADSAEADRKQTAALLDYTKIKAPFDGVVTRRTVDAGWLVQAPTGATPGAPLFVEARTDVVRVFVDVPEADAAQVADGMSAQVRVQSLQDQEFSGRVARSSFALDNQARTLHTEIDLPNADGRLRPGQYAVARLTVERPGALTLPAAALLTQDDQPAVMRVEDGKAVRTPVKLGSRQGAYVEVLKKQTQPPEHGEPAAWEDFTGSEEIVTSAPSALTDGQAVRVQAGPGAVEIARASASR